MRSDDPSTAFAARIAPMKRTPSVVVACLLAFAVLPTAVGGCADPIPEDAAVREAFARLIVALDEKNAPGLWEMTDETARRYFDDLAAEIRSMRAEIDQRYPTQDRATARRATGGELFPPGVDGHTVFLAVLDPDKLAGPSDPASRTVKRVFEGDGAYIVSTQGGETILFRRDSDGAIRTSFLVDSFKALPAVRTLRENLTTARQNLATIGKASEASATPTTAPATPAAPPPTGVTQ